MYKTIRHGENSLQYTILPQNDDFRIEGKLSSAGSSSSSSGIGSASGNSNGNGPTTASGRKSKAKRPKRRSFFAYLGLIFVCTVIVGAILIPFLVSAECLPSPTEWFLKTKAALIKSGGGGGGGGSEHNGSGNASSNGNRNANGNGINVGKTVKIISKDGVEKIILKLNKTSSSAEQQTSVNHVIVPLSRLDKTLEITSNTSNLNKSAETAAGNAAIAQQMKTEHGDGESDSDDDVFDDSEKETDMQRHEDANSDLNDSNSNTNNNNNDKPITRTDKFENAEGASDRVALVAAAAAPPAAATTTSVMAPTMVATMLRGQQQQQQQQEQLNNNINEPPATKTYVSAPITRPTSSFYTSSVNSPRVPPNPNQNAPLNSNPNNSAAPPAMPTIMTRIIQVPLLKAAAKKPIIPPVLAKTNSQLYYSPSSSSSSSSSSSAYKNNNIMVDSSSGSDSSAASVAVVEQPQLDVVPAAAPIDTQPPKNTDWVHSHWPYVDPTTYFQWNGYKAQDSVLLPALLGFAIVGMILVTTVCLISRNRRTIVSSVRKRNRNDIEEMGAEDNATLLTAANLSDED